MRYTNTTDSYYYNRLSYQGYHHLILCNLRKAEYNFYARRYLPSDPKHIWLSENMKRKTRYDLKRYIFHDRGRDRMGVAFRDIEDAMAFKLRWS